MIEVNRHIYPELFAELDGLTEEDKLNRLFVLATVGVSHLGCIDKSNLASADKEIDEDTEEPPSFDIFKSKSMFDADDMK